MMPHHDVVEHEVSPIPVYMVSNDKAPSEINRLRITRYVIPADGSVITIAAHNPQRTQVSVGADSNNTGPMYLSNHRNISATNLENAYGLMPGNSLTMNHTHAMHVFGVVGNMVYVLEEWRDA